MANWTAAHVRRLFWRAGFGARPDEVRQWTRRGKDATIDWLVGAQGEPRYTGPAPSADGRPLDPLNEFGHDRLLWLDRMVRTGHPLREKMTLFWHDHFATFGQPTPLMLAQNDTQRRLALESFDELLRAMTLDPALGRALSLTKSAKKDPNENFGRELFELYTLGGGHTEDDVREAARALTGLREIVGAQGSGVVFDPARHDGGVKTIFGVSGALDWEDVLRMSVEHPAHAPFLVGKLWDFFVGTPIDAGRRAALASVYVSGGRRLRPVLRQILADPALYRKLGSPEMVKWPAVYVAGQLRAMRAPVDRVGYGDLMAEMGQALFAPPSVAGWDWGTAWLSSGAMHARFELASRLVDKRGPAAVAPNGVPRDLPASRHLAQAIAAVGHPPVPPRTRTVLVRLIRSYGTSRPSVVNAVQLQRTLRHLLISDPENQLC